MTETTKFKVGAFIEWASQSAGTRSKKQGTVLCMLAGGASLFDRLKMIGHTNVPPSRIKAQDRAQNARYLVAVPQSLKRREVLLFYAPLIKVIDGDGNGAGKIARKPR